MEEFIKKHWLFLIFAIIISYLFITADPIDYCQEDQRYLDREWFIDKAINNTAKLLKMGYPDNIDNGARKYKKNNISDEDVKPYYEMLKKYYIQHPQHITVWNSMRNRYTTLTRLPINVRMIYIPDKKDCENIMKNNIFEDVNRLTEYERKGYHVQWIKQICTNENTSYSDKKMIGYSIRFVFDSCGNYGFHTGFLPIFENEPLPQIEPTLLEKLK